MREAMLVSKATEQFIHDYIWQHGYSTKTADNYRWAINSFVKAVDDKHLSAITQADVITWRKYMESHQYTVGAVNAFLYRFRYLLRYYRKKVKLRIDPDDIIIPKKEKKLPKTITQEQIQTMIDTAPLREKAIIATLYSSGIRVGELVKIQRKDITGDIIKIRGKGNKERLAFLDGRAARILSEYLQVRTDPSPYLFYSRKQRALSTTQVQNLIREVGVDAGIGLVTPHMFRHSFATHMVQNGCGSFHLQKMLGHEHISTTQIYVHLNDTDLVSAYRQYHVVS